MASEPKTTVKIVLGAMTMGKEGAEQARVHSLKDCGAMLDVFQAHGHKQIDTSIVYGEGSSEVYLGELHWQERGLVMDTKYYPGVDIGVGRPGNHTGPDLRTALKKSLTSLQAKKINMWYLHAPDRKTPYEETMRAINELHQEGLFEHFGLSNYAAWEVAQICEICQHHGWVAPVAYQGIYNALRRDVEAELIPCLRQYGMALFAFNPLAGGYLTDRYQRDTATGTLEPGSRFDPSRRQGASYRARYWHPAYFDALDLLRAAAKSHGLTEAECALRWMTHHSQLAAPTADAIIIGASSAAQLDANLVNLEKGPLPDDVLAAFDEGWAMVKGLGGTYFH